jgi:hypothetical protein
MHITKRKHYYCISIIIHKTFKIFILSSVKIVPDDNILKYVREHFFAEDKHIDNLLSIVDIQIEIC